MIDTKKIKKTMLHKGITTQMMCKKLRISYHSLIMILDKDYSPMWEHLCGIASMIGCSPIDLIVKEIAEGNSTSLQSKSRKEDEQMRN